MSADSQEQPDTNEFTQHIPVLYREIVEGLNPQPGQTIVDATCGGGGHTLLLAKQVAPDGVVIGADRDPAAIERCERRLSGLPVKLVVANFADVPEVLEANNHVPVDGICLDLGLSSDQLADEQRGFSYQSSGPLDLRFDTTSGSPAWKLLDRMSEKHLANLIYKWGEERFSRRIAREIVRRRQDDPVRTADQLAQLLRRVVPRAKNHSIDPATRTFQALRIAVNEELKWVEVALRRLPDTLSTGGRIAVISFHSLEDRLVKTAFRENENLRVITRKAIKPAEDEIESNPRSRSARLRIAERI
ncbi:MAG: 16S rRNA (cytosine(1402)-N(4))-methyltransferase RsmH [Planctomycetaceae bacterium]|nr:16S rRNA (cytosine(1402)-N(4))-methyltransferase RsmH [Planctomycetaceae bacterium]